MDDAQTYAAANRTVYFEIGPETSRTLLLRLGGKVDTFERPMNRFIFQLIINRG